MTRLESSFALAVADGQACSGVNADAPPFLFMTAFGDVDAAVELMREGVADYLAKPFDMDVFLQRVKGSLRSSPSKADGMTLGVSPAMRDIEHLLRVVSKIDSSVLITGETGTGKDVCARFQHQLAEKRGPFMAVNCAAIPSDFLESELFGHKAGAFTGAGKRHLGFAERAGEGTLFLDEIGELTPPCKPSSCSFWRTGSSTGPAEKRPLPSKGASSRRPMPGDHRIGYAV